MRERLIVLLMIVGPFVEACGTRTGGSSRPTEDTPASTESTAPSASLAGTAISDSQPVGAELGGPATRGDSTGAWPLEQAPDDWRAQGSPEIPLVAGLTEIVAVQESQADYESIGTVQSVTASAVTYSFGVRSASVSAMTANRARRIVSRRDLEGARGYRMTFSFADPDSFPGQTAVGVSSAVFRELQDRGRSRLNLYASTDVVAAVASILSAVGAGSSDPAGELARVESETVGVPVLVNGRRVWLPALHAKGEFRQIDHALQAELWVLADARNPMTLRAAIDGARLQVVRIDFPTAETGTALERALADKQPVEMWGVYFDFASAHLQPESMTVLDEVVAVLRRHPDWRIRIEGHTDNVGSEADNLRLSQQRAEAVRTEVARRLGDDGRRLEVAGYGASRPRESNTTLSGRARNRRVELVRQ
jgi:outer membrane protein OmpA-like peptidoglycan-associated protein